ncbi:hypothetical protein ACGFX7_00840 [Streptomyces harbinensis]|uniref:hypothetical protein n=1 Tax=Streptomyces harbinensis TaxID=1176198 RepID=UPI0037133980
MSGAAFPHLAAVRSAITALYRGLSPGTVRGFATSVLPVDVAFDDAEDLRAGVERVALVMVRHLGLPEAPVRVRFTEMPEAAWVERDGGAGGYTVDLHRRFDGQRRDIGAVLAHEVMHVHLHRAGLGLPVTAEDEILTDTAAAYLGVGWLLLDAFREDALGSQRLGYLTPQEYGYVLARRAAVFGEDPRIWFTSPQAYDAYEAGRRLAERDAVRPPLAGGPWAARQRYAAERALAARGRAVPEAVAGGGAGYAFEQDGSGGRLKVVFGCPVCGQKLRLPVAGRSRARCGLCRTVLECDT